MDNTIFAELLKPVHKDKPAGMDLRAENSIQSLYYQIKDARHAARLAERQSLQNDQNASSMDQWQKVYELGIEILKHHSKDLEITAWFIEALLRKHGLSGLHQGFRLAWMLIDKYWDVLYPAPDEDGLERKVAAFSGLNGEDSPGSLVVPIAHLPLTAGDSGSLFALWQYKQALEVSRFSDKNKQAKRIADMGFSLVEIQQAVAESGAAFYQRLQGDIDACLESLQALDSIFTEKCAEHAPSVSFIKAALIEVQDHVRFLLADAPFTVGTTNNAAQTQQDENMRQSENPEPEQIQAEQSEDHPLMFTADKNLSRQEALSVLNKIAVFFEQTEPHSPIPFLLRRAVRWGNLSLPDLLAELITEEEIRRKVFNLTGIVREESS